MKKYLINVESEIHSFYVSNSIGIISTDEKNRLVALKAQKNNVLQMEEEAWWIKSQTIWLRQFDRNTSFP